MKKKDIKKHISIKKKKNHIHISVYIFILAVFIVIVLLSKATITPYAIKEGDSFGGNVKIEIPDSYKTIKAGECLWFTIKLMNLGSQGRVDVTIKYEILDSNKKSIITKSETVAIETQASFVRQLEIPIDSPAGVYDIDTKVVYADGKEALAEETFNVIKEKNYNYLIYIIVPVLIVLMVIIIIILLMRSRVLIERFRLKMKIHNIVKKRSKY